jgi:hypothetical protein
VVPTSEKISQLKRVKLQFAQENWTIDQLVLLDLRDRPFLHEQGNSVTRGFVRFLSVDQSSWELVVRDVEYLDKRDGTWRPDAQEDRYGGDKEHAHIVRYWSGLHPIFDVGIEINSYGAMVFIGVRSDRPWTDTNWPELDTDWLRPGPMSE